MGGGGGEGAQIDERMMQAVLAARNGEGKSKGESRREGFPTLN